MSDRRIEILQKCWTNYSKGNSHASRFDEDWLLDAMDEYFRIRSFELLEYMANNKVECLRDENNEAVYYRGNDHYTKEQLFENFL